MSWWRWPESERVTSLRRQWLDADLEAVGGVLRGLVLEVGSGHAGRRGTFRPPGQTVRRWLHLDIEAAAAPDVQADVERLPLKDSAFDVVVCLEVLEYVRLPCVALSEMRRVLRAGGTLVLSTPFMHRKDSAHDYWRFTEPGLRRLLSDAGYELLSIHAHGAALGVAVSILKYALDRQPPALRRAIGLVAWPLLLLLRRLDAKAAGQEPRLGAFSTGYLVVARA